PHYFIPTLLCIVCPLLSSTLFPYTTLFRSVIPWTLPRILATVLFIVTALAWIFGSLLQKHLGITSPDTFVAIACAVSVVVLGLRSEEHTSELQSRFELVCRLPLEYKKTVTA